MTGFSEDDLQYAFGNTRVLREPDRRIDTFGTTRFEYFLVSELMDSVNQVRVREGRIEADRPRILRPEAYWQLVFEGFGEQGERVADLLRRSGADRKLVQYSFRKEDLGESLVHEPFGDVCERVTRRAEASGNPLVAVIQGVDDTWEVCLLRFTLELVEKSRGINLFDFKRKGLL
jgi:hypothetical protein